MEIMQTINLRSSKKIKRTKKKTEKKNKKKSKNKTRDNNQATKKKTHPTKNKGSLMSWKIELVN